MPSCENKTCDSVDFFGSSVTLNTIHVLFGVISAMLILSLFLNIYCCVSRFCSGKPCQRRSQTPRQMEENPIYGNVTYTQTSLTEVELPHSSLISSTLRDQQTSKTQDCYANLTLKPPRQQSGRSSPQIQYSDVVQLEGPPESVKENESNTDAVSTMSDLYASVQTQRTKTVHTADTGEDYANHL